MSTPLAKKVEGKKFMWDGGTYDDPGQTKQVMEDYAKEGFDVLGIPFVEVYVATPLEVCESRDPKGLYARARRGEVARFTGISAPYEAPHDPDVEVVTTGKTPDQSAREVLSVLQAKGLAG